MAAWAIGETVDEVDEVDETDRVLVRVLVNTATRWGAE